MFCAFLTLEMIPFVLMVLHFPRWVGCHLAKNLLMCARCSDNKWRILHMECLRASTLAHLMTARVQQLPRFLNGRRTRAEQRCSDAAIAAHLLTFKYVPSRYIFFYSSSLFNCTNLTWAAITFGRVSFAELIALTRGSYAVRLAT